MKSKIRSKYQVTIPEGVRQTLGLNVDDTIQFSLSEDGGILIQKEEKDLENVALYNFLELLLAQKPLLLEGGAGVGKTYLATMLLENMSDDVSVFVYKFDDYDNREYKAHLKDVENITIEDEPDLADFIIIERGLTILIAYAEQLVLPSSDSHTIESTIRDYMSDEDENSKKLFKVKCSRLYKGNIEEVQNNDKTIHLGTLR